MKKAAFYFISITILSYLIVAHVRKNENFSSANHVENLDYKIKQNYVGVDMSDNEINRLLRSKYSDPIYLGATDYWDIYDSLARNQPWYAKLGNGLAMAFVNIMVLPADIVGIFYGIVDAVKKRDISALWDNQLTNAVSEGIETIRKEYFLNYKSKVEQERSWWENFGTAAFFADYILEQIWIVVYIYLCYFVKKQFKWSTSTKSPKKE